MDINHILQLPFTREGGWQQLRRERPSLNALILRVVLPLSLLPPLMLHYAIHRHGDTLLSGLAERPWAIIAPALFTAELLTFLVMGWLIHGVAHAHRLRLNRADAYLLAAMAPLPLWFSSLTLFIPDMLFIVSGVLLAMMVSCGLIYHGLEALTEREDDDVMVMSATYTVMAFGLMAWGVLLALVWAL
ncbi:YIP1 family protein [Billgrantia sp. LNSP4103-1]|uniref:YIP1 family protein n=1 Tax=Billgrantia sp. LNSP4103-1 TaxID=3410266 RepID=UPI00403F063C